MRIRFLYYGTRKDGKIMDDIIGRTTHKANKKRMLAYGWEPDQVPMLAHGEVMLFNTDGLRVGTCYTSTMGQMRDRGIIKNLLSKGDGTVSRPSSEVLTHPERWYYIDVDVSIDLFFIVENYLMTEVLNNQGYDFLCILSFLCGVRFHASKRNICSEIQHRAALLITTACYASRFKDTWRDVPSPILQMINMVSCGSVLRRLYNDEVVLEL